MSSQSSPAIARQRKIVVALAAFTLLSMLAGFSLFTATGPDNMSDAGNFKVSANNALSADQKGRPVAASNPLAGFRSLRENSRIRFLFNEASRTFYLFVEGATRKEAIHLVADGIAHELATDHATDSFLESHINLEMTGTFDDIVRALVEDTAYRFMVVTDTSTSGLEEEVSILCLGKYACQEFRSTPVFYENLNKIEEEDEPDEQLLQVLNTDTSPNAGAPPDGQQQRSQILQIEFAHANPVIKARILQSLDKRIDQDFIIDALVFDENTQVREVAAHALFPPHTDTARLALLESLGSSDEALVMSVARLFEYSDDEDLRYQAARALDSHPNHAIQKLARAVEQGRLP